MIAQYQRGQLEWLVAMSLDKWVLRHDGIMQASHGRTAGCMYVGCRDLRKKSKCNELQIEKNKDSTGVTGANWHFSPVVGTMTTRLSTQVLLTSWLFFSLWRLQSPGHLWTIERRGPTARSCQINSFNEWIRVPQEFRVDLEWWLANAADRSKFSNNEAEAIPAAQRKFVKLVTLVIDYWSTHEEGYWESTSSRHCIIKGKLQYSSTLCINTGGIKPQRKGSNNLGKW